MDIDDEWENFMSDALVENVNIMEKIPQEVPKATDIYISTKSMLAFLNYPIDLNIFWELNVIPYSQATNGIVKKQIKYISKDLEDLQTIQEKLKKELYYDEQVIIHINNPNGRIKFKDIRKITVGISQKDILSYRSKKKQAFYNCFVIIMRLKIGDTFKEIHVKVFNTGKVEIPGIQNEETFEEVLKQLVGYLQPHMTDKLSYNNSSDTVLINSNFNCGFYINRDKLADILKYKYHIDCFYDPCNYPGIQCKIKIDKSTDSIITGEIKKEAKENKEEKKKKQLSSVIKLNMKNNEISFMIFRTGSILIVGKCNEIILFKIYEFLKNILKEEYLEINQQNIDQQPEKIKKKKIRKKMIEFNN